MIILLHKCRSAGKSNVYIKICYGLSKKDYWFTAKNSYFKIVEILYPCIIQRLTLAKLQFIKN